MSLFTHSSDEDDVEDVKEPTPFPPILTPTPSLVEPPVAASASGGRGLSVEERLLIAKKKVLELSDTVNNLDEMFIFTLKCQCVVASALASEHEVFDKIVGAGAISGRMEICGVLANGLRTSVDSLNKDGEMVELNDGGAYKALGELITAEEKAEEERVQSESALKFAHGEKKRPGRPKGGARSKTGTDLPTAEAKKAASDAAKGSRLNQQRDLSTPGAKKAAAQEAAVAASASRSHLYFDGRECDISSIKKSENGIAVHTVVGEDAVALQLAPKHKRLRLSIRTADKARIDMNKASTEAERQKDSKLMATSVGNFAAAIITSTLKGIDGPVYIPGLHKKEKKETDESVVKKQGALVTQLIKCAGLECGMNDRMTEDFANAVSAKAVTHLLSVASQLKVRKVKTQKKASGTLQQQHEERQQEEREKREGDGDSCVDDDAANEYPSDNGSDSD